MCQFCLSVLSVVKLHVGSIVFIYLAYRWLMMKSFDLWILLKMYSSKVTVYMYLLTTMIHVILCGQYHTPQIQKWTPWALESKNWIANPVPFFSLSSCMCNFVMSTYMYIRQAHSAVLAHTAHSTYLMSGKVLEPWSQYIHSPLPLPDMHRCYHVTGPCLFKRSS